MRRAAFFVCLILMFCARVCYAQITPEEAEAAYRADGCAPVGVNSTGGTSFQCCGMCPTLEILKLHDPSWDIPIVIPDPEPSCEGTDCTEPPIEIPIEFPIVLVAEAFDSNTGWVNDTGWMATPEGDPQVNLSDTSGPELGYDIAFNDPEPLYVWILGDFVSGSSDSVHFGIDGIFIESLTFLNLSWSNTLQAGGRAIIQATPGQHILNIWQREDGTRIQEIRITNDPDYTP